MKAYNIETYRFKPDNENSINLPTIDLVPILIQ